MITFLKKLAAAVATPSTGKVTLFVEDSTGEPSYKDEAGAVTSLQGATGATGATGAAGQGVPTGGTTGQVLEKIDGTDYNTQWATPAAGAVSSVNGATGVVDTFGTGLDVDATGFRGIPQNSQSGNYTCVAADAGKEIYHPSGAGASDIFTIPANGSVAYEIGTAITFTNMDSNALSIAITTDTLYLAGAGTTGTRTLAQYGTAVAVKKTSTTWLISGINLT